MVFELTEEIFKWSIIGIIAFTTVIITPRIALITRQMSSKSQKKLKPFLGNKDTQKFLIDYAQKNPEKVSGMIQKMVKKPKELVNNGGSETNDKEFQLSV